MDSGKILEMFGEHVWMPENRTNCLYDFDGESINFYDGRYVYSIEQAEPVAKSGNLILFICEENGERFQAIFDLVREVDDVYDHTEEGC